MNKHETKRSAANPNWLFEWSKRLIIGSVTLVFVAALGIGLMGDPGRIADQAASADRFADLVQREVQPPPDCRDDTTAIKRPPLPSTDISLANRAVQNDPCLFYYSSMPRLRTAMGIDSFVLVPAYTSLMVVGALLLFASRGGIETEQQARTFGWSGRVLLWANLVCALPLMGALFDIAENAFTIRAAEDALHLVLGDDTVNDIHLATRLKWILLSLGSLQLGVQALIAARHDAHRINRIAAFVIFFAALASLTFVGLERAGTILELETQSKACGASLAIAWLAAACAAWPRMAGEPRPQPRINRE